MSGAVLLPGLVRDVHQIEFAECDAGGRNPQMGGDAVSILEGDCGMGFSVGLKQVFRNSFSIHWHDTPAFGVFVCNLVSPR